MATAKVRSEISFSLKCEHTSSYAVSGTWPLVIRVTLFSAHAQILPVHIKTVGASVDLRGPQFNQMKQGFIESTFMKILLQGSGVRADLRVGYSASRSASAGAENTE